MLACLITLGCASAADAPVDRYATATITPGAGLGDLVLGGTTLDQFLKRVGKGQFMLAVSDESAFEFRFHGTQLAAQFIIAGECDRQIGVTRDLSRASPHLDAYLAAHPACRDLPLTSVSVSIDNSMGPRFYTGSTDRGVKLGDVITATAPHGESKPGVPRQVAGLSPSNPENVLEFPGMLVYYTAGASGKIDDTSIRRITVFVDAQP